MDSTRDGPTIISPLMETSIMYEILSRVPTKSLFRFKTVSKGFLNLITDTSFARLRSSTRTRRSDIDGFFYLKDERWDFVPSPYMNLDGNFLLEQHREDIQPLHVIDSCNGLVLLARSVRRFTKAPYRVCNPLTMEWTTLPPPSSNRSGSKLEFGLVADPGGSTHHFKVVCLSEPKDGHSFEDIEIYSSQTGQWVCHDLGFPLSHYAIGRSKAFFRGKLFWSCLDGHILVCSITEDHPWLINVPDAAIGTSLWVSSYDQLLCYCRGVTSEHSLWALDLDNSHDRWKVEFSNEFNNMIEDISSIYNDRIRPPSPQFQILGFDHGQDVIFLWVPHAILSYHVPTRRLDWIAGGLAMKFRMDHIAFPYVDSLLSSPLMKSSIQQVKKKVKDRR